MEEVKVVRENPLGTAPLLPLILRFAVPSVISMLVLSLYNLTDQIFIGNVVGMLGNAATNVAFPTVTFTNGIGMLFGIGAAANFSIMQGAKREEEARKFITTGLAGIVTAGLIVCAFIFICMDWVITICGADPASNVFPYAKEYVGITAIGLPFAMFGSSSANLIRADGSPRYAMAATVSGVLLNVVLDWFFMFPLDMGIKGAAIATVCGQFTTTVIGALYFRKFKAFKIHLKDIRLRGHYILRGMAVGAPNFVNHMLMMTVNIVLNNVLTTYGETSIYGGDIPLAVSGVAAKVGMIMVSFSVGIAQGCQPIYGFNLGAGNYKRVKSTYRYSFAIAFIIGLIFFTCLQIWPREIISIFGSGDELYYQFAVKYLTIYMMLVFCQNIQPVTTNFFTGTGKALMGVIVSLSRQGVFLIPLLVILPKFLGIDGVLYANPIADALSFILSITMVSINFKKLTDMEKNNVRVA